MPGAVDDARKKLMPSRMLFSIKDPNKVVPGLKQEQVLGLYQAQHRPAKFVNHFPDEASALAAIKRGDVAMSDEINIGKMPGSKGYAASDSSAPTNTTEAWEGL